MIDRLDRLDRLDRFKKGLPIRIVKLYFKP